MQLYYSIDFAPAASPPRPDHNRSDRLRGMAEQGFVPHPALVKQALQRLNSDQSRKSNRVDLETAQTVAVFLMVEAYQTRWEAEFLHSVVHDWRRDPTPKQLRKLRQIARNPPALVTLVQSFAPRWQRRKWRGAMNKPHFQPPSPLAWDARGGTGWRH
jgi:hypothetical protein